jgi:hypothetical protein
MMLSRSEFGACALHPEDERPARLPTTYFVFLPWDFAVRAAVTGERPETLPSAKISKWRDSDNS